MFFFQPSVFQTSWKNVFLPFLFFRRVREPPEGGAICLGRVREEVRGHQQEVGGLVIVLVFSVIVFSVIVFSVIVFVFK